MNKLTYIQFLGVITLIVIIAFAFVRIIIYFDPPYLVKYSFWDWSKMFVFIWIGAMALYSIAFFLGRNS